jgi:SAM-dependent methyltransferase
MARGSGGARRARRRGARRRSRARSADRYELYERSVQEPDPDLHLVRRIFRRHYGRAPRLLREDFCGTAAIACRWVELHPENRAFGIDLDPEPLAWGRRHHLERLSPARSARVKLIEGDVRDIGHAKVDVTVAFNFSYFCLKTRDALRDYFEKARASLRPEGVLVLDAYGGSDSQRVCQEVRKLDGFDYVWDQHSFDPISHHVVNYIHFAFPDRSRMRRAFRYDWRLWSLPEIRELLLEAGFARSEVYWEGTEQASNEGNGIFTRRERASDDPAWVCYIAGIR